MSRILITGAGGYVGQQLAAALARDHQVVGMDIRPAPASLRDTVTWWQRDIRDPELATLMAQQGIEQVVHLAAVLEDSGDRARDFDIDVNGTENVLAACASSQVRHIVVTSSGAAYGYHADNPPWLKESDALRGNPEFAYADHKRQVEGLLAAYRKQHPELQQLVLRVGTVLGENTDNQITKLFSARRMLKIKGSDSPFVFIWDQDLLAIIDQGVRRQQAGIFNVAGDGALTVGELAAMMGKPVVTMPASVIKAALWLGCRLRLSRYAPVQVNFLRYRPVLDNQHLKQEFGYLPQKSSRQVFSYYLEHARRRGKL